MFEVDVQRGDAQQTLGWNNVRMDQAQRAVGHVRIVAGDVDLEVRAQRWGSDMGRFLGKRDATLTSGFLCNKLHYGGACAVFAVGHARRGCNGG